MARRDAAGRVFGAYAPPRSSKQVQPRTPDAEIESLPNAQRAARSGALHSYACMGVSMPEHKFEELIAGALLALR